MTSLRKPQDQIDASDSASITNHAVEVLSLMAAELSSIAAGIDRVIEASHPTMELLEASRSIHKAILLLGRLERLRR